jgi:hypothetical protein
MLLHPLLVALGLLAAARTAPADCLLITEVVTDPQLDHSESSGGNQVRFDALPGDGAVSSIDEFVEIYNAGVAAVDLRGFALEFLDTTPARFELGASRSGTLRLSPGSTLEGLLPGGYLLLGNPPGALNNRIDIALRDPDGAVVDLLRVENGKAHSAFEEAVARRWTGTRFLPGTHRAPVSPLGPGVPRPIPEPAAWLLAALSAAAAVLRSSARTGRHASSRRP